MRVALSLKVQTKKATMFFILSIAVLFVVGANAQVEPKGRCECSIFVETTRTVGDPYAGPLWLLEHNNTDEYRCDDYLDSGCYLLCKEVMEEWLDSLEGDSLDDEIEVEIAPGEFETYKYGEWFCRRSYITWPGGNPDNYDGIRNEPLLLATRLEVGNCRPWDVKREYPERKLCCNSSYKYFPEDECPWPSN